MENLVCVICQDQMIFPVTLNCGHTYCKQCIKRALLGKPVCPTCRTPTLVNPDNLKENIAIRKVLEHSAEYRKRVQDLEAAEAKGKATLRNDRQQ